MAAGRVEPARQITGPTRRRLRWRFEKSPAISNSGLNHSGAGTYQCPVSALPHSSHFEIKMRFAEFAASAAVAAALFAGSQTHAAPVVVGTYYDETITGTCSSQTNCSVFFSQTPANKMVMVKKLHCKIQTTQPIYVGGLFVSTDGIPNALQRWLPLPLPNVAYTGPVPNTDFSAFFDMTTEWLVGQGRFPFVRVSTATTSNSAILCTLIGALVDP